MATKFVPRRQWEFVDPTLLARVRETLQSPGTIKWEETGRPRTYKLKLTIDPKEPAMFEKFTDRARRVVQLARQEALTEGHPKTGVGHVLLGLVKETSNVGGMAIARVFLSHTPNALEGVYSGPLDENLRQDLIKLVRDHHRAVIGGDVVTKQTGEYPPFTPGAEELFARARAAAKAAGHNYVGAEHLLLALLEDEGSPAGQVLKRMGIGAKELTTAVKDLGGFNTPLLTAEKAEVIKSLRPMAEQLAAFHKSMAPSPPGGIDDPVWYNDRGEPGKPTPGPHLTRWMGVDPAEGGDDLPDQLKAVPAGFSTTPYEPDDPAAYEKGDCKLDGTAIPPYADPGLETQKYLTDQETRRARISAAARLLSSEMEIPPTVADAATGFLVREFTADLPTTCGGGAKTDIFSEVLRAAYQQDKCREDGQ